MNAILPDDLSHYARESGASGNRSTVRSLQVDDSGPISEWDGHSGLEMEPGTEMSWVGPEPLR